MFLYNSLLIGLIGLATIGAGVMAYARNSKGSQNRWFLLLSLSIGVWTIANFIDSNVVSSTWTGIALKADFALALFIAWAFFGFSHVFPLKTRTVLRNTISAAELRVLTLVINLAFVILIASNFLFTYTIGGDSLQVTYHWGYWVYVALLLTYFFSAFSRLITTRRTVPAFDRAAINILGAGLVVAFISNVLTNLVFPNVIDSRTVVQSLNIVGYLGLLGFVICVYIGITTRRLFDIRPVIARSLGYVFTLSAVAAIYGFIVFGTAQFGFGLHFSILVQVFLSALTGLSALLFVILKKRFDRLTNRLFYRDSYSTGELYDRLNKILVSTYDLNRLLRAVSQLLAEELKATYVALELKEIVGQGRRFVGTTKVNIPVQDVLTIQNYTMRHRQNVIATDQLEETGSTEFKKILRHHDIAVLVRLAPHMQRGTEGLGYLIVGPKKSGNLYTQQDLRVLDTIGNELILAIQNALHFEEIQNFNKTLQEKVIEATKELRRTNEKLRALDETKDDFISMASHQLRTPLTSVKGYLSMVLEGDVGKISDTQRKMLTQAFISSQRMVYLIADLLNVSRLKTGKFIIEPSPIDLSQLIADEIAQLQETAASRSIELSYEPPKDFPLLMLDETKTRQVIMNFIDNSIYYTPAGGHIRVELADNPHTVELRVVDDGIGVPKSEQHHLFTKFYRAGNARKARPDGTGLGLFMAKKVITAQGGAIIFDSQENKGSTFGFTFSKARLAAPVVTRSTKQPVAAA